MTVERINGTRSPDVGIVLAGGGARGAYEAGALSVLMPELEKRGELPGIVLGTSIGALNASHLAATAHLSAAESMERLIKLWVEAQFSEIIGPLVSPREIGRVLGYVGGLLSIPGCSSPALLDTTPMPDTLRRLIPFSQLHRNVDNGLVSLAVIATSYATGDSVVFLDSQRAAAVPPDDVGRGIVYAPTRIEEPHVHASASIPVAFPATRVDAPAKAAGWYGDGGTRLNTPIKPALELGAKRVVVIGLNSTAPPSQPELGPPDLFDGAAQYMQALFADPLAQDVETLSRNNVDARERPAGTHAQVPYIFIAPHDRQTVGEIAAKTFRELRCDVKAVIRARDLLTLGTIVGAGRDAARGELFSLLFFATEFHTALIELGKGDAKRWLQTHPADNPWRLLPPPVPSSTRRGRSIRPPRAKSGAAA